MRKPDGEEGVVPSVCLQIVSPDLHSMERVQIARAHAFQRWRHVLDAALVAALRLYEATLSSSSSSSSAAETDVGEAEEWQQKQRESPKEKRLQDERVKEKDSVTGSAGSEAKEGGGQEMNRFLFDLDAFLQAILASRTGAENGHGAATKEPKSNSCGGSEAEEIAALCKLLRQHCLRNLTASCSQSRTKANNNNSASGSGRSDPTEVKQLRLTLAQVSEMARLLSILKVLLRLLCSAPPIVFDFSRVY